MSATELRTRILIASGLAAVFIGYFIYSYQADADSGSWVALAIDGILLAIGTFCAFEVIRSLWRLSSARTEVVSRPAKDSESINFRG